MRFSLRFKLLLVSLLLLVIPLLGLRLNNSLKTSLISSKEEALKLTALAVSAALNNRADLFVQERFHSLRQDRDLYLFQLANPIQLNGDTEDWLPEFNQAQTFGEEYLLSETPYFNPESLSFKHIACKQEPYLYALFDVVDDQVTYRDRNSLSVIRSDHLQITIGDEQHSRRYVVPGYEPGWVMGFLMPDDPAQFPTVEKQINGKWKQTEKGYTLEIRIHTDLLGSKLAFAVADVDNEETGSIDALIGTAKVQDDEEELGWLLTTSTGIEAILESLDLPYARFRVVDQNQRIRAEVGGLHAPSDLQAVDQGTGGNFLERVMAGLHKIFQPLFSFFTSQFSNDIKDSASQPTEIDIQGIEEGFAGKNSLTRYRINDGLVEVMAAITPVYGGDDVVAVVVVEQTTNSILFLSNQLIEETILLSLVAFLLGGGALFVFAFVISSRIRTLRNQADASITEDGAIRNAITKTQARDEIGDLGRTLSTMLVQLQEQIDYREKMADNLEHEMRTPLAGVAASLKNIEEELGDGQTQVLEYLDGAKHNTRRLHELLTAIREAVTLKDSLSQEHMEEINLSEAVSKWLDFVWQKAFTDVEFIYEPRVQTAAVKVDTDRLLQALDKLIENAVSYHTRGTPIELILDKDGDALSLQVINQGSTIDPSIQHQIFEYMVSNRVSKDSHPHLGLGLYIAKTIIEHQGGRLHGSNLDNGRDGAVFTVEIPGAK